MKIYTRTGDKGTTGLFGTKRVSKASLRIEAIGTVDELNSAIGIAVAQLGSKKHESRIKGELEQIQSDLFEIGSGLATPKNSSIAKGQTLHKQLPHYLTTRVGELETYIDTLTKDIPPMTAFILPGGSVAGSHIHVARSICRRAERRVVELSAKEFVVDGIQIYLNRLSDTLFTIARYINAKAKKQETKWHSRNVNHEPACNYLRKAMAGRS